MNSAVGRYGRRPSKHTRTVRIDATGLSTRPHRDDDGGNAPDCSLSRCRCGEGTLRNERVKMTIKIFFVRMKEMENLLSGPGRWLELNPVSRGRGQGAVEWRGAGFPFAAILCVSASGWDGSNSNITDGVGVTAQSQIIQSALIGMASELPSHPCIGYLIYSCSCLVSRCTVLHNHPQTLPSCLTPCATPSRIHNNDVTTSGSEHSGKKNWTANQRWSQCGP